MCLSCLMRLSIFIALVGSVSVAKKDPGLFSLWSTDSGLEMLEINQRNYGVAVADVNFDGSFEFIIAGFMGPNIVLTYREKDGYFENLAIKNSAFQNLRDEQGQAIGVCACDIDGDGTEEIYFLNTNNAYAGLSSYGDKLFKWRDDQYVDLFSDPINKNISAVNFAGRSVVCLDRYGRGKYGFMIATYAEDGSGEFALIEMDDFHPENDIIAGKIVLKNSAFESGLQKSTGGRSIVVGPILNNEGKLDIFFGNEGNSWLKNEGGNYLFKNIGNGTYVDVAKHYDMTDEHEAARGVTLADFNQDGLLDIVCCNYDGPSKIYIQSTDKGGTRKFTDKATPDVQKNFLVRTVFSADFDNDKHQEIVINNIYEYDNPQPNIAFKVTSYGPEFEVGITKINVGDAIEDDMYGTGGAYADVDKDGRLELLLSHGESFPQPLEIYKVVHGPDHNWLRVYVTTRFGAPARGATVKLKTKSGDSLLQVIDSGSGYLCQMEPVAHFGLAYDTAVYVIVQWPDGKSYHRALGDKEINVFITVEHPDFAGYQKAQKASNLTVTETLVPSSSNHTEL